MLNFLYLEYVSYAFADTFKYSQLVLDTTYYCASIFPVMSFFIERLVERNFQNRNFAFIENVSRAVTEKKVILEKLKECDLTYAKQSINIKSALCTRSIKKLKIYLMNWLVIKELRNK